MPDRRARGYQPFWKPRASTLELLVAVDRVLDRYTAQLPLTIRQIWYSLISDGVLPKEGRPYKRLIEVMGMARRSGRVPWEALRDDTEIRAEPAFYAGPDDFRAALRQAAAEYQLDRQTGQPLRLEVWSESGMVSQLRAVAGPYGVPVYSGSGFSGLPAKRAAALRAAADRRPAKVSVVSDWDPSGVHLFSALAEDVSAFAAVDAPGIEVVFERLAVTEQQIEEYRLPTAPTKVSDNRAFTGISTTQAEALPPDILAAVVRDAITSHHDPDILAGLLEREERERRGLLGSLGFQADPGPD
ncbi:hypothetical protein ACFXKW_35870 [Streptomyces sp. NPDC059193]|uniref:hypothetical protein n=1 Tax=Streptomyces sp. NPDC059193 TaxID=3346763 RepID=UPI003686F618